MEFNVTSICPEGNIHTATLEEYAEVIAEGLRSRGYNTECASNNIVQGKKNVILGSHLLTKEQHSSVPSDSIIVNLEQLAARGAPVSQAYFELLEKHVIWDYSKHNVEYLRKKFGVEHALYLPTSTHSSLRSRIAADTQDIDVLFYGVLNERRRAILNELDSAGLNVQVLVGVYGAERDSFIARSKVILSVSYYDTKILESVRILDAMAKGKAVIAECNDDTDFDSRMVEGAELCPYEDLVDRCVHYVSDEAARRSLEAAAHGACEALDITETIQDPLASLPNAEASLSARAFDAVERGLSVSVGEMLDLMRGGEEYRAEQMAIAMIAENPAVPEAWHVVGAIAVGREQLTEAETAFRCVVNLAPESPAGYENLGRVLVALGRASDALAHIERAFELTPDSFSIGELLVGLLVHEHEYERALTIGQELAGVKPDSKVILVEMARACRGLDRVAPACQLYLAAVATDLSDIKVQEELAIYFYENGRTSDAIAFYADLLERDSLNPNALHGLGTCYQFMGHLETALELYEQVLKLSPNMPGTLRNIAHVYHVLMRPVEAIQAISRLVDLTDDTSAKIQQAFYRKHICDWSESININAVFEGKTEYFSSSPFQVLPMIDDPKLQLMLSQQYRKKKDTVCVKPSEKASSDKLRVGFFGSDFHEHATLVLMSGMFREYDKSKFEFFVYSYGLNRVSAHRKAVETQVDVFHNLESATDGEIVALAIADDLDIAIDLKGFTNTGRIEPFEHGLAPIQISFLGYPGTLGRECFDYMIADNTTIPRELEGGYSEKIMVMPHAYQPNDNQRHSEFKDDTRAEHGLPEKGFVFCCFNNSYKISSEEFDIWMRLLSKVDDSVLWLLDANEHVKTNLKLEAEKRGVSGERLIFAPRVSVPEHLSRHQHADLFLDTFNVNAHTTCSDALWAGLPVISKLGKQFAARVSGSLLRAALLPDLVCETADQYEALALTLARSPARLQAIKAHLKANKSSLPLFDTDLYMRDFEDLLTIAVQRRRDGLPPCRLEVGDKKADQPDAA